MAKFQDKYRIESARAPWWDYANDGTYFITICTAGREWLLGEISDRAMHLSAIGDMVYEEWNISFEIRSELFCEAFVMMPNHIHAILRIETRATAMPIVVETHGRASLQQSASGSSGVAYRSPRSISSFVAGFKSAATKKINEYRQTPKMPVWQTRFHDHIIRSADEYERIFHYIEANLENWENDPFYQPLHTQP